MISGCATTEGRVIRAAEVKGRSEAKTVVPDLPAECRQHMERVIPKEGDKARWIQARWETNADAVDRQIDDCAAFQDGYKRRVEAR
jgi:cytochrome c5